ncbi:hypothetical protein Tco_1248855, partial [Tanacetum coccineum]
MPPRKRSCLSTLESRYEIGESSIVIPTRGQGVDYGFVSTVDAETRRQGIRDVGYSIRDTWVDPVEAVHEVEPMTLGEAWAHAIGLSRAVHHKLQTHHDHEYAHGTQIQVHQTQLQLQGTLIQTQHQVHETRSQMQQAEMAELRE